jgi:hypothetical protein
MSPFQATGELARWRIIYDLLRETPVNEVLSYEALGDALGVDPIRDRPTIQGPMRRAKRELLQQDHHAIEVVRDKGYRVVDAVGHLRLARKQQGRAALAVREGHEVATRVDLTGADPGVRNLLEVVAAAFQRQADAIRSLDVRQRNLETAVTAIRGENERTAEERTEILARLERLETRFDQRV